ncbi:hypothetical protein ACFVT1_34820 [Streptomyces sp. NPDC057963]|uniref:hypothetical protein n=1 Tax=Streptomyces sp. NPDC057963 TaxID=3346290 RepID=UPI0036EB29A9
MGSPMPSVSYGMRAVLVRLSVPTTATPSAVATQARPSPPTTSPYGAAPASTGSKAPRSGSTNVTVSAPESATRSVPDGVRPDGAGADRSGAGSELLPRAFSL